MTRQPKTVASHAGAWEGPEREIQPGGDVAGSWRVYEPLRLPPVLKHALDAFAAQGYHGTSVRDIARRLKQTVPAIYYHYENKQALLVALLQGSMSEVLQRCQLALRDLPDEDPVRRFEQLIRCVVIYVGHRRELIQLDAEIRSLETSNRRAYVALRDQLESLVVDAIRCAAERDDFATRDPVVAARATLSMCLGIAHWYSPRGTMSPEDLADAYVDFAFGIVGSVRPPIGTRDLEDPIEL